MTDTAAQDLRESYLARLDDAMRALPHGVASDIRGGIAEELQGLDAQATAARIVQLGDPADIAREAAVEASGTPVVIAAPERTPAIERAPVVARRGYAIVSALVLSFGGFVVPVVGWFVGAVLVSSSTLWKTGEKIAAIAVPFAVAAIAIVIAQVTGLASSPPAGNPLVPSLGGWHLMILSGLVLIPASGLWLLWRLRGRPAD